MLIDKPFAISVDNFVDSLSARLAKPDKSRHSRWRPGKGLNFKFVINQQLAFAIRFVAGVPGVPRAGAV
jgi:hypothetical protein